MIRRGAPALVHPVATTGHRAVQRQIASHCGTACTDRSPCCSSAHQADQGRMPDSFAPFPPPELLDSLVDAVREPLLVCLGQITSSGAFAPGRILTANAMACTLLNRDLEVIKSMPLTSLVTTASGRPPPHGLVSKCTLYCADADSVAVEVDCRVFTSGLGGRDDHLPLFFCHLSLLDVLSPTRDRRGRTMDSSHGAASTTMVTKEVDAVTAEVTTTDAEEDVDWPEASPRARALADVQLERLRILVVEDDLCEHNPARAPTLTNDGEFLAPRVVTMLLPAPHLQSRRLLSWSFAASATSLSIPSLQERNAFARSRPTSSGRFASVSTLSCVM